MQLQASSSRGGVAKEFSVFVGNLESETPVAEMEELLYELFLQAGPLSHVHIPFEKDSGRHKCYGFVEFLHTESVPYAIKLMQGVRLCGKVINVKPVTQSDNKQTTPTATPSNPFFVALEGHVQPLLPATPTHFPPPFLLPGGNMDVPLPVTHLPPPPLFPKPPFSHHEGTHSFPPLRTEVQSAFHFPPPPLPMPPIQANGNGPPPFLPLPLGVNGPPPPLLIMPLLQTEANGPPPSLSLPLLQADPNGPPPLMPPDPNGPPPPLPMPSLQTDVNGFPLQTDVSGLSHVNGLQRLHEKRLCAQDHPSWMREDIKQKISQYHLNELEYTFRQLKQTMATVRPPSDRVLPPLPPNPFIK